MMNILITILFSISIFSSAYAKSPIVQEGAYVQDTDKTLLRSLTVNKDLTFDHITSQGFEVYGPKGMLQFLSNHQIEHRSLESERGNDVFDYPTPQEVEAKIYDLNKQFPTLTQVIQIGTSVQGRKLLVLKISDNAASDEAEPEFKYISSMHGDEITGRELMLEMAKDLLEGYATSDKIKSLIDSTEIYIMPSMNPDGSAAKRRGNANYVDLNRDFPDFSTSDNQDNPQGRAIETQAVMNFQKQRQFALSVNFHGGAEVVNYAWDTIPDKHPFYNLLVSLSLAYADKVPYISASTEFNQGITNGYEWYEVNGGMQDWSYYWYNDLQFTIELSQNKWPNYSRIPYYYDQNKVPLVDFIGFVHMGAGFQLEKSNINGTVAIIQRIGNQDKNIGTYKFRNSEFYKVLEPGQYHFEIKGQGIEMKTLDVTVHKQDANFKPNYSFVN